MGAVRHSASVTLGCMSRTASAAWRASVASWRNVSSQNTYAAIDVVVSEFVAIISRHILSTLPGGRWTQQTVPESKLASVLFGAFPFLARECAWIIKWGELPN